MSSDASPKAPAADAASKDVSPAAAESGDQATAPVASKVADAEAAPAPAPAKAPVSDDSEKATEAADKTAEDPVNKPDVEMADDAAPAAVETESGSAEQDAATALADASAATPTPSKKKAPPRRSVGGSESKGKKLNKKASKARITHLDAQPGDHFFVKLKGFPQWPVIICDEDMLPFSLLKSRPVTAKRPDGTYREDVADGGKKAADRTFPVMYLHTNEFGWVPNTDLIDLDPATVKDMKTDLKRKDLQAAHELASQNNNLTFYKDLLHQYQEELLQQEEAEEKAKAAKAATPNKKKIKVVSSADDEDVEVPDAADEETTSVKEKKTKKRKAEETVETPQRTDSVKKPKIKLTTSSTPKAPNGTASASKPAKSASEKKPAKSKAAKPKEAEEKKAEKEVVTPKEPEVSPEEKHARKEKEVLFLRHKLQKGLLTRDQEPKEEEMEIMSEYVLKLEGLPDLEVSIIKATKINKVLKAILKLDNIPKEDEFKFKPRSQALLDKWNKLLTADGAPSAPAASEGTNGVNGTSKETKTNGVKAAEHEKAKEDSAPAAKSDEKPASKPATEETKAPAAVEASA
ncbi:hypothetical protein B0T24DRAFT_604795 [Lasiosphaeria ovina]|uniref:PWWP domain-containing protein n=1 Tax=Lasiosphaeria ovina TaxID=92902 RepID=A0AAE0TXR6_9PEZI|nr:hypothetical protein B0T24DRAFT_604795 [Lasiosphaeria ovina]